jgi:hypothetical protein
MKVRIEVEIGDKIIADEFIVTDAQFKLSRFPSTLMHDIHRELWLRMAEAREQAITEFCHTAADLVKGEWV